MVESIAAIPQAISGALTAAKAVYSIASAISNADLKLAIAELTSKLADAKMECTELVEKIKTLEKIIALSEDLKLNGSLFYKTSDGTGPYCPVCYSANKVSVLLVEASNAFIRESHGRFRCAICKTSNFKAKEE